VMSVDECQILAVGYSWQGSQDIYYYPQGCFISSNYYVYYNTYESTTSCSYSYPCICVEGGGYQDGYGTAAQFKGPRGITISSDGTKVFVADSQSEHIDKDHDNEDVDIHVASDCQGQVTCTWSHETTSGRNMAVSC